MACEDNVTRPSLFGIFAGSARLIARRLATHLALARTEAELRRRNHRRRRPRARDGLLPRCQSRDQAMWLCLERAYIGSGNVGRNTTIIRSNYVLRRQHSVLRALSETLGGTVRKTLNFNVMLSQRGQVTLGRIPLAARRAGAQGQHHALERHRRRASRSRRDR